MELRKVFPKWNEVDKKCPECNQVTHRVRGVTKQNLKRLITPKLDWQEFMITFILIMVLLIAWLYSVETKQAREFVKQIEENKAAFCNVDYVEGQSPKLETNYSILNDFIQNEKNK